MTQLDRTARYDLLSNGHLGCAGCAAPLALRYTMEVLGPKTMVVMVASCASIVCGPYPHSALKVPMLHTAFATGGAAGAGLRAGLDMTGREDVTVLTWAGDGGVFDIGLQAISGAAERNDNMIFVCYDNEAYMNTGAQRSSATPSGAWTTTTTTTKDRPKKDIIRILAAHDIPYAATASTAYPEDFMAKMAKAKAMTGFRFFHVLAVCPTGWRLPSHLSVKAARLAVQTNVFPLYEVIDGRDYRLTVESPGKPVEEYLSIQGRFSDLSERQIAAVQGQVNDSWTRLQRRLTD